MNTRKALSFFFTLALGLVMLAPVTRADERNQATQLTFDQSVQIPNNTVLPAGTYWFKLVDTPTNQNIVQVFDVNWQPITTAITASTERFMPTGHTMLTLAERSSDQPPVLLKWYYPGDTFGHEFVYSGRTGRTLSEDTTGVVNVYAHEAPQVPAGAYSASGY